MNYEPLYAELALPEMPTEREPEKPKDPQWSVIIIDLDGETIERVPFSRQAQ